jgi:hypothetical protein
VTVASTTRIGEFTLILILEAVALKSSQKGKKGETFGMSLKREGSEEER